MKLSNKGFGAYDIRGVYPEDVNEELAYRIGRVFPGLFDAKKVAVGHDIRLSGPSIRDALVKGLTEAGCDVMDIGQCGTEMIYFTTAHFGLDGGIMITASHNPKEYNGMKFVPSLDDKTSVNPYVARADARFLHNNMDYAITATFDFNCQMSPREKIRGSIFKPTARRIFDRSSSSVLQKR